MPNKSQHPYRRAFTIVELLIVIVIIGILAGIIIVAYNGMQNRAKVSAIQSELHNAQTILRSEQSTRGLYPESLDKANHGTGIKPPNGTSYYYYANNSSTPKSFCLTAVSGDILYHISEKNKPLEGPCNAEKSLSFDGSNDWISLPNTSTLKPIQAITVESWFNTIGNSGGGGHWIILVGRDVTSGYGLQQVTTRINASAWGISGRSLISYPISLNKWTHVTFSYKSGDGGKLYINGELVATSPNMGDMKYPEMYTGSPSIGAHGSNLYFFKGKILKFQIWDYARSQTEIKSDMYQELTGNEPGLVGYWPMHEGSGNVIYDLSPNHNNGTINGATWSTP